MPDANGWALVEECLTKLQLIQVRTGVSLVVTDAMLEELGNLLPAIAAEFQSPPGRLGDGGTGRIFTPYAGTRTYDGNGFGEIRIDDVVPGSALTVAAYGVAIPQAVLKQEDNGGGWNILALPQGFGIPLGLTFGYRSIWPLGDQNITVTTTWGYAAQVPTDVWEAQREEAVYRLLVTSQVPLAGIGERRVEGDMQIDNRSHWQVFEKSSPVAVLHDNYTARILAYRDSGARKMKTLAPRMA